MLRTTRGNLKASVPIALVCDYWQIPFGKKPKRAEVDMFISHIFELGLEKYEPKGRENVQDKSL